jgi:hypothetical protein
MKLFTIYRTLGYRKAHPAVFTEGEYIPVAAEGPLLAYIRRHGQDWVLVLVPLISGEDAPAVFPLMLPAEAPDTWVDVFSGDVHHASADVGLSGTGASAEVGLGAAGGMGGGLLLEWKGWSRFPVALLIGRPAIATADL